MEEPKFINIGIAKNESKLVLALIGHLRKLVGTVFDIPNQRVRHPLEMDQAGLLMCSASLRTLFFDDSPAPILTNFLKQHNIPFEVEALETDFAMLLFAQVAPREVGHISDFFMEVLLGKKFSDNFLLNVPHKIYAAFGEGNKLYASLSQRPDVWLPRPETIPDTMYPVGFTADEPVQFSTITRRKVPLEEWGNLTIGYLKGIPIRRKNIINYVANKLGGVHYDASRFLSKKDEKSEFKVLVEAYDWESDAIMHAGLVVVALACIEITNNPTIISLLFSCEDFEKARVDRLLKNP